MAAPGATRKAKKVSKNKKKNWRKHVNIDDVEEYLEDKRLQERTGGLVAEKSDEALFFIEKSSKSPREKKLATKKRRPAKDKPLKCFANLQPDSSIKIPKVPRSELPRSLKKLDKVNDKKIKRLTFEQKKKAAAKARAKSSVLKSGIQSSVYDLWDENTKEKLFKNKYSLKGNINKYSEEHYLRQTRKKDVKIPNTGTVTSKPSALPSVEVPHAGASYNPTYDDHQELLEKALCVEVAKEKKEKKITRALDEMFPKSAPTEASRLLEMSVGIFSPINDGDDEDEPEVTDSVSYNPPVRREDKKTITQRNKEKRLKEKQQKLQDAKDIKLQKREIFQLKSLKKETELQRKRMELKMAKKNEKKLNEPFTTKKLGKMKFEEPDVELKLGDELEGSLRLLKPEGHLLSDRFKSLQKRNLIETRGRAKQKRKYKLKEFEKKSHREVTL